MTPRSRETRLEIERDASSAIGIMTRPADKLGNTMVATLSASVSGVLMRWTSFTIRRSAIEAGSANNDDDDAR